MTWLTLESVGLSFKGVRGKPTPSIRLNKTLSYETQNSLEKFKSKPRHTHSTVLAFHQNHLHSQNPHHTATGWGHTGRCCTRSQTPHTSSSLQKCICMVQVEITYPRALYFQWGQNCILTCSIPHPTANIQEKLRKIFFFLSPRRERWSFERPKGY